MFGEMVHYFLKNKKSRMKQQSSGWARRLITNYHAKGEGFCGNYELKIITRSGRLCPNCEWWIMDEFILFTIPVRKSLIVSFLLELKDFLLRLQ
ncbi:hypothetical protein Calab_0326 [Caldithrix abyssi DSM 13497]|uniref:Uncharacterized protein n=1 Tax=Caldithrix abyssi DSM 13497 TaxID=880073 RepID=H1XPQ1_CALAY|nr:hypothetical protein Calab_0326 [Caldithrix abyssi DSM 13497]